MGWGVVGLSKGADNNPIKRVWRINIEWIYEFRTHTGWTEQYGQSSMFCCALRSEPRDIYRILSLIFLRYV